MKNFPKIDRFYLVFGAILVPLAIFVLFVLQSVLGSFNTARQIDDSLFDVASPRLNRQQLIEAQESVSTDDAPTLDLRE